MNTYIAESIRAGTIKFADIIYYSCMYIMHTLEFYYALSRFVKSTIKVARVKGLQTLL